MSTVMIKCPACNSDVPFGSRFCPNCGFVFADNSASLTSPVLTETVVTTTSLDDVPVTGAIPPPAVVYMQSPPVRETGNNNGLVITLVSLGLIALVAVVVWNLGYLSHAEPATTTTIPPGSPPSTISIDNPPAQTQNTPALPPNITINTPPAAQPPAANPGTLPPATPPPATPPPSAVPPVDVVSVSAEATNTTAPQWHYGYTLKLRNNTGKDQTVNLRIKYLDGDGYVVDDAVMNKVFVPANKEQDYEDFKLIDAEKAAKVKSVKAEIR